jgi:hypothetical protein
LIRSISIVYFSGSTSRSGTVKLLADDAFSARLPSISTTSIEPSSNSSRCGKLPTWSSVKSE